MQARTATRRAGGIGREPFLNEAAYRSFAFRNVETSDMLALLPLLAPAPEDLGRKAKARSGISVAGSNASKRLVQPCFMGQARLPRVGRDDNSAPRSNASFLL
jgi:hypothetical protein